MQILIRKIATLLQLDLQEMVWFFLFYPVSGLIRLVVLIFPFRYYSGLLGLPYQNLQLTPLASTRQIELAKTIGRTCKRISNYTPWSSNCLVQALLGEFLLRWYHIPFVLHLGVSFEQNKRTLIAHAWLKVGDEIITGKSGHHIYSTVASFVSPNIADPLDE